MIANRMLCCCVVLIMFGYASASSEQGRAADRLGSPEPNASSLATLPTNPSRYGFSVAVEMAKSPANGYQPIYFTFASPAGRFIADRTFDFTLRPISQSKSDLDFLFRTRVTVPQASVSETFVCYVPYYVPWDRLEVIVNEPGQTIQGNRRTCNVGSMPLRIANQTMTVGIIHPLKGANLGPFPDVRTLVTLLGSGQSVKGPIAEDVEVSRLSDVASRQRAEAVQPAFVQFRSITPGAMFPSWLGYSQLDVILIHGPTLIEVAEDSATDRFAALCDFVAAGGNLWVYDAAKLPSAFADLNWSTIESKVVRKPESIARLYLSLKNDTSDLLYEAWGEVRKESQDWQWNQNGRELELRRKIYDKMVAVKHPSIAFEPPDQLAKAIQTVAYGTGRIVAIERTDPFPGSFQLWQSVADLSGNKQLHWSERNGIDVRYGDDHYWSLLIESVGGPPVKIFFLINTLFILVVGPVAYIFFRRKQRLYLLLFVAPAIAFLVTAGLFMSAILADGFATRVRARQITWQDSDAGYLVHHDRATYFSAVGRGDGILVPEETELLPVLSQPAENQYYGSSGNSTSLRTVSDLGNQNRFTGQFLPSRAQVQYLSLRPVRSAPLVTFSMTNDAIGAKNNSSSPIEAVVVCDDQGRLWKADQVQPESTVEMEPLSGKGVQDQINVSPLRLASFVPTLSYSYYRRGSSGVAISAVEENLNRWLGALPKGTFIATTNLRSESLGIDRPEAEKSVHVIMGELP
ncbi:hypothetical protein Q31b_16130 [Novipirellula aureliae]|uniref:DUF4350 domain-containing protein n=1 Tax=Novipirellula aureliae TaxID=2527966 RepID=A0A5C6E5E9_9BACT|nr:hypothetical protein [Novipirellula aureliae]TWU44078.1 hypothetical protein Q31b_16130 [Novipirellula aureliae]